jgi:hypothetical protein
VDLLGGTAPGWSLRSHQVSPSQSLLGFGSKHDQNYAFRDGAETQNLVSHLHKTFMVLKCLKIFTKNIELTFFPEIL